MDLTVQVGSAWLLHEQHADLTVQVIMSELPAVRTWSERFTDLSCDDTSPVIDSCCPVVCKGICVAVSRGFRYLFILPPVLFMCNTVFQSSKTVMSYVT